MFQKVNLELITTNHPITRRKAASPTHLGGLEQQPALFLSVFAVARPSSARARSRFPDRTERFLEFAEFLSGSVEGG